MVAQQKKSGLFFNKNIIDEINSVPEERVENEEQTPPAAQAQTQAKPAPALKMVSDNTRKASGRNPRVKTFDF